MKTNRFIAAGLIIALLFTLTGCLKFKDSFDLIYASTEEPAFATQEPAAAPTEPLPSEGSSEETTASQENEPTAEIPDDTTDSGEEDTTDASVISPSAATEPVPAIPANNEYDILRSGNFTMKATMLADNVESTVDMSVSKDGNFYINTEVDGMEMGILVQNNRTYLVYPPEKKYLRLNSAVASLLKMDPSQFTEIADEMGFETMEPLSSADRVTDGQFRGTACKVYHVPYGNGAFSNVYLNGTKLLGIENLSASGNIESTMIIRSVSAGFPQMPPADYSESKYLEFFQILYKSME